jgi:prophage antirepressor-like protein
MQTLQNKNPSQINTEITIYTFENQTFRVVGTHDKPQFVVKDVCDILGLSNVTQAIKSIPEEWKADFNPIKDANGRSQQMLTVYEPGLYHLIMRSDKAVAKKFQKWTFEDVLPSIRKKGEYVLEEYKKKLEEQEKALEEQKKINEEKTKEVELQKIATEKQKIQIKHLENRILARQSKEKKPGQYIIYILSSKYHLQDRVYVFGKSLNLINVRKTQYDKTVEHDIIYYKECGSRSIMDLTEKMVFAKLDKYREQLNRERFILPEGYDISLFTKTIDDCVKFFEDVPETVEIKPNTKEDHDNYYKDYSETNKTEINEKRNERRKENPEEIRSKEKEYWSKNTDKKREKNKKYYESHKEILSEKYREKYVEKRDEILEKTKARHEKNKEKDLEYLKTYRQKNKEALKLKKTEKITCDCGIEFTRQCKSRHENSNRHQEFLKQNVCNSQ